MDKFKLPIYDLLSSEEVSSLNKQYDELLAQSSYYSKRLPGCWSYNELGIPRRIYGTHLLIDYAWLISKVSSYAEAMFKEKAIFFASRLVQESSGSKQVSSIHQDIFYTAESGPKRYAVYGIFLTNCTPGNAVRVLTNWVPENSLMLPQHGALSESILPEVQVWHSVGGVAGQMFEMTGHHLHQIPLTAYTQDRRILWLIYTPDSDGDWSKHYLKTRLSNKQSEI